jgi:hypothetical protein
VDKVLIRSAARFATITYVRTHTNWFAAICSAEWY